MLYRDPPLDGPAFGDDELVKGPQRSVLLMAVGAIRRRLKSLIAWIIGCLAAAAIYIMVTPAEFAATSLIILEPRRPAFLTQNDVGQLQQNLDTPQIESQVQIIKSGRIVSAVIKEMDLASDPDLTNPRRGLIAWVRDLLFDEVEKPVTLPVAVFSERINVRRVGQSLVLEISVRASTPEQSAALTNAVVAAYLYDQVSSKLVDTRRTGDWLQSRIEDMRNQQQAALAAMRTGIAAEVPFPAADVRILNTATPPSGKSFPKTTLIMIFAMTFALVTGVGAVVVGRLMDRRVWSVEDMAETIRKRCITSVPRVRGLKLKGGARRPVALELATQKPWTRFAESFRTIRNAVLNNGQSAPRTIGLVSWRHGEGTTMMSANLAHTLAASGASVVLVDADIRSAVLTRTMTPDATIGLADLIQPVDGVQPELISISRSLNFLPALQKGKKAEPFLFVGSQAVRDLLQDLSRDNIVIVDMPPMSESNDAVAMAPLLDGVILVIEAGRTKVEEVAQAIDALEHVKTHVLGTVINKQRELPGA
ncbi:MAG: P-loop NTPase [Beijerinckiaceae bacterium]|nr:P-loop NTPase [Beijerinckiaceae bacterium]MDO9443317.1 P-loop NTPase [Beijerinckiaceae bacterium]